MAGAPPTDWSYYDTIYTERYMRTPQQNPAGYDATDLIDKAGQIKAQPLLIHGLADTQCSPAEHRQLHPSAEAADKQFDFVPSA